jgi:hypothetical protein
MLALVQVMLGAAASAQVHSSDGLGVTSSYMMLPLHRK